ncbi:hypothetical protein MMC14_007793 [Varicellaria rhodocarpa]|nr:hypothetical protein [Varicellaria rhodocarpa]
MLRILFRRRSSRTRLFKSITAILVTSILIDFLQLSWIFSQESCPSETARSEKNPERTPKVFIASTHWNNEASLRGFWNQAVLDLAEHLGPDNVYISIYESGSWDDSKNALRQLDHDLERLGVQRTIELKDTTHADEIAKPSGEEGWIDTPRGTKELRRIPYLAKLRNLSLKPMMEMALNGVKYDKVLFLNDVAFTTQDIMALINTRDGNYSAVCAMDFMSPPQYYDTFALRDSEGHDTVTSTFPYFRSRASRNAMLSGQPIPVQSCWNGAVVFAAYSFYKTPSPLRFRGTPDTLAAKHLEGSECCLIHFDNPLTPSKGVWVNPRVRVGYSFHAYREVHSTKGCWPSATAKFAGLWQNRIWRWTSLTFWTDRVVRNTVNSWESAMGTESHEPGFSCLINEMQVLVSNGWAHL